MKNKGSSLNNNHDTNELTGLTDTEVQSRQRIYGRNTIQNKKMNIFAILIRQCTSNPLLLVLIAATVISFFIGERVSSYYIFGIIIAGVLLGFWNEYAAEKTIDGLMKKITATALVIRDNSKQEIPASELTIGDIILLSQGSIIPADVRFIETNQLEVNESALTGEAKTIYKTNTTLGFMGTNVESGSGKAVVLQIGKDTEFGKIAKSTTFVKPETEFQKGLATFGGFIIKIIFILTIVIFVVNALLGHPILESVLFALAIAVGLTPELLPVIVTVSLSHGAGKLAKKHVVVKHLLSLENLGNMDILCTDKTGTLTEGSITVVDYNNLHDKKDANVLEAALISNTATIHHKVKGNAIDVALWEHALKSNIAPSKTLKKFSEEPFDYNRKAMYTVAKTNNTLLLFAKGAPESIIPLCNNIPNKQTLNKKFNALRENGLRVIVIATKAMTEKKHYGWEDMNHLTFIGYITFLDLPKKTASNALKQLQAVNVSTRVITGDNEIITQKICREVGMPVEGLLVGPDIEKLSDQALAKQVNQITIFARVTPLQKLRVIKAFQANGHTVGYMGDGINDLPALHNADIGISVNTAVDVAKDAASVVLLRKGIDVIDDGIREGRKTFSNTIKYILMSTSSNFGNMFSAAGASFFLPFLPMSPLQILTNNSLYDISQMTIPSDNVDHASLVKPRHWNIKFIKDYMLFFGPISSIYDYAMFGILLFVFHADKALFQTGWFIESLATQVLVVFVIRTAKKPFFLSKPSRWLTITSISIVMIGALLPFTPLAKYLGLVAPPPLFFVILILLVTTYLFLVEFVKSTFLKKYTL